MPGNNFCQSPSHSPLRATCNKNANYLRKYNVRSAKGLSGVGREGGVDCLASRVSIRGMQPRTMLDTKLQIMQFVRTSIANCECNQHKLFDL